MRLEDELNLICRILNRHVGDEHTKAWGFDAIRCEMHHSWVEGESFSFSLHVPWKTTLKGDERFAAKHQLEEAIWHDVWALVSADVGHSIAIWLEPVEDEKDDNATD